jgi:uncharacterized protein (TIGR02588 family)
MSETQTSRQVGRFEWGVAALGALLVVGVLATLTHEALTFEDGPPVIVASTDAVTPTEGGHVVQFTARNLGARPAAEVAITARLSQDGAVVEEAEVTLDYIARRSSREAGVIFKADPRSGTLDYSATSYRNP